MDRVEEAVEGGVKVSSSLMTSSPLVPSDQIIRGGGTLHPLLYFSRSSFQFHLLYSSVLILFLSQSTSCSTISPAVSPTNPQTCVCEESQDQAAHPAFHISKNEQFPQIFYSGRMINLHGSISKSVVFHQMPSMLPELGCETTDDAHQYRRK